MPSKYVLQQRGANGLENKAEIPALENGKIDMSLLPVVGESGAAIIARGSNANGEWVRWEDGTQVCYKIVTPVIATGDTYVDSYFTYPAAFIASPIIAASAARSEMTDVSLRSVGPTNVQFRVKIASVQDSAFNANMHYIAIGRWK